MASAGYSPSSPIASRPSLRQDRHRARLYPSHEHVTDVSPRTAPSVILASWPPRIPRSSPRPDLSSRSAASDSAPDSDPSHRQPRDMSPAHRVRQSETQLACPMAQPPAARAAPGPRITRADDDQMTRRAAGGTRPDVLHHRQGGAVEGVQVVAHDAQQLHLLGGRVESAVAHHERRAAERRRRRDAAVEHSGRRVLDQLETVLGVDAVQLTAGRRMVHRQPAWLRRGPRSGARDASRNSVVRCPADRRIRGYAPSSAPRLLREGARACENDA